MILYKKDSKNKVRIWSVEVSNRGDYSEIKVTHGEEYGAKQEKVTKIFKGKNIGKANETTHYEQAVKEAESKYKRQLDKGYSDNPDNFVFRPMLAHRFDKFSHKVKYPAFIQPKLDGIRNCIYYDGKWKSQSRNGKPVKMVEHILEEIESLNLPKNIILDGELYVHGMSFQKIIGAVKRDTPNENTKDIVFHCYDIIDIDDLGMVYSDRLELIDLHFSSLKTIMSVRTDLINNNTDVWKLFDEYTRLGYEGAIVRNANSSYKIDGRSYDLLKVKEFIDSEYKIINYNTDKEGGIVFVCITSSGKTFNVRPEGTIEFRRKCIENFDEIQNKMLTVRFFEYTDDGIPRFPVGVCVRNYE